MKPLFHGWRYAAVCSLLVALPVGVACSAPATGTGSGNLTEGSGDLEIYFPKMFSAVAPGHVFKVPAKVDGVKKVKWSADPEDAVEFEKQEEDGEVMITMKKAYDEVTITATAGGLSGSAPLKITSATAEEWNEGKERYNNGVVIVRPGRPDGGWGGPGGGGGRPDGGRGERKVDPKLACTNCHAKGGQGGNDVEHTPTQTGGYSDEELATIMTKATKPAGQKMRITTLEKWQKFHKWDMSPEEQKGIIVYLRALEPESQGEVDFGGHIFGGKGGGKGGGKDKGSSSGSSKSGEESK